MKAVVNQRYGGPEVLRVADVPTPAPAAGQVLVKIAATSINLSDWEGLRGSPFYARLGGLRAPRRRTLGSGIAGHAAVVGTDRDRLLADGPGPSIVDLPSPGCWSLDLTWGSHHDHLDLAYTPAWVRQPGLAARRDTRRKDVQRSPRRCCFAGVGPGALRALLEDLVPVHLAEWVGDELDARPVGVAEVDRHTAVHFVVDPGLGEPGDQRVPVL